MQDLINKFISNRYLPRWVVFTGDSIIVALSFILAFTLRHNFLMGSNELTNLQTQLPVIIAFYWISFAVFKPFAGLIRFTVTKDLLLIFLSVMSATSMAFLFTLAAWLLHTESVWIFSKSILIIAMMVTGSILTFSRLLVKYVYNNIHVGRGYSINVLIYGAGDLGQTTLIALQKSKNPSYNLAGFIDSNPRLWGLKKNGSYIYSPETAFQEIIKEKRVTEIIIAISPVRIDQKENKTLIDYCIKNNIIVKKVPPINDWMNGSFSPHQTKRVDISDLLGREEIFLDKDKIQCGLAGKTILITGAAGSIGSEIVRQLASFHPEKLVLVDQAESALYDLQMELARKYNGSGKYEMVIADITNYQRMDNIFKNYRPVIVFNAAAYKHVPLLEDNVCEAVRVNIGGTKLIADLSIKYGVEKFVMISSDKAVNPTNVMGATKRISEMYVQSLTSVDGISTHFITTRFGNVLGSNGSVVPLFSKQIEEGGPVTITHMDIERFFMTIPEACQLVLEAGFLGRGGEIFVFDMGEPVKIYDLAVKMISLAGLEPVTDIKIVETGLRPGEKLYEELLASKEETQPTHHPKIMIANMRKLDPAFVKKNINEILASVMNEPEDELVAKLKSLVPEFTPLNPKYRDYVKTEISEAPEEAAVSSGSPDIDSL